MTNDKLELKPISDKGGLKFTNDKMMKELTEIFQLYIEYSDKTFKWHYIDLNINEVHAIQCIGSTDRANVTRITKYLKITKGAVTKITKRLISNGYLSSYQVEENRKEKYFKLTDKGKTVFEKHEVIHSEAFQKDKKMFDQFDDEAKNIIFEFLKVLKNDLSVKLK